MKEDIFLTKESVSVIWKLHPFLTGIIAPTRPVMNAQTRFATISFLNALLLASVVVVVRHRIGAS